MIEKNCKVVEDNMEGIWPNQQSKGKCPQETMAELRDDVLWGTWQEWEPQASKMLLSAVEEAKWRTGEGEKLHKKEELDQVESFTIIHWPQFSHLALWVRQCYFSELEIRAHTEWGNGPKFTQFKGTQQWDWNKVYALPKYGFSNYSPKDSQKQKILKRGSRKTQKNYTKEVLITKITTMVWSLT